MERYALKRIGSLLVTKAAITGPAGTKVLNLLVDTGSTYTIIPKEILEATGCSPIGSKEHVRIITGSGVIISPQVEVSSFHCMGRHLKKFKVVAHTLPPESAVDGLLGMDFLPKFKARIDTHKGGIELF